jgi:hypothetical protein
LIGLFHDINAKEEIADSDAHDSMYKGSHLTGRLLSFSSFSSFSSFPSFFSLSLVSKE